MILIKISSLNNTCRNRFKQIMLTLHGNQKSNFIFWFIILKNLAIFNKKGVHVFPINLSITLCKYLIFGIRNLPFMMFIIY